MDRGSANQHINGWPIGDSCVWAAISYLDSATDYRECLPQNSRDVAMSGDDNNSPYAVSSLAVVIPGFMLIILQLLAIFL